MRAWAYKEFKLRQLFSAQTGDIDLQQKDINGRGLFFINSGVEELGIKGRTDREAKVFNENTITVDFFGNAYFRDHKYKLATHNHVFSLSGEVIKNRHIGLYLVSAMSYFTKLFSFNNMGTWPKIKELSIKLPVNSSGEIDFAFMQARIQEMEQARIQEMDTYLKVAGFENCELTDEETDALKKMRKGFVGFKTFYVTDDKASHRTNGIFYVNNSHNILQSSILADSGNTPYVTAGESNNSVSTYISYDRNLIEKGNSIMIGGKTMVITYQAEDFFSNDSHNLVLYAKNDNLCNELNQLFLVTSLGKSLKPIYSWGDSISKAKIKKDILRLPVTSSGEIDYHFMETYIRAQEKLAIQRVKDWREKEIAATKEVVDADTVRPTFKKKRNARFIYIPSSEIAPSQRYTTHLPVYPLRAACGYFDECGRLPEEEAEGWLDVSGRLRHLNKDMYIVHAEGRSMEPKIHDGDLCVFEKTTGSRQGKIVLAKAKDELDPDAGSYTIKQYSSEKCFNEDGNWHHTRIVLTPLNPEFHSIIIDTKGAGEVDFQIYGELIHVIPQDSGIL